MLEINVVSANYLDKGLAKATERVARVADGMNGNAFEIAWIIASVADDFDNGAISDADGFKNVHEWTANAFGFKKTTSYNLLAIGREYTAEITNGKKKTYRDNITNPGEKGFSISQCMLFLKYHPNDINYLFETGVISPAMSCRDLAKALKKALDGETEPDETETDETAESETEEMENHVVRVTDSAGIVYNVPFEILIKYMSETENHTPTE